MSASIEEEVDICYKPGKNNVPMLVHVDLDKNKTKKRKIGEYVTVFFLLFFLNLYSSFLFVVNFFRWFVCLCYFFVPNTWC